jgi:hypothetical protein
MSVLCLGRTRSAGLCAGGKQATSWPADPSTGSANSSKLFAASKPPTCRLAESSDLCRWRKEPATPAARCRPDGRLCASHENALGLPGGWVAAAAGRPPGGTKFLSDVIVVILTARPEPRTARGGPSRASGAATILANASAGARMTGNWAAPGGAGWQPGRPGPLGPRIRLLRTTYDRKVGAAGDLHRDVGAAGTCTGTWARLRAGPSGGWAAAAGRPAGGWQGGRGCGPAGRAPGARPGAAGRRPAFLASIR